MRKEFQSYTVSGLESALGRALRLQRAVGSAQCPDECGDLRHRRYHYT